MADAAKDSAEQRITKLEAKNERLFNEVEKLRADVRILTFENTTLKLRVGTKPQWNYMLFPNNGIGN